MHRPRSAAVLVATLALGLLATASVLAADALEQARALLAKQDARGAAAVLEAALSAGPSSRAAVLDLLRQAYALAARQAESAGKAHEAEMYRDDLEILNRKSQRAAEPRRPPVEAPKPTAAAPNHDEMPSPVPLDRDPGARQAPIDGALVRSGIPGPEGPPPAVAPPTDVPVRAVSNPSEPTPTPPPAGFPGPNESANATAGAPSMPTAAPEVTVAAADAAFVKPNYDEAGRLYGILLREKRLPDSRRDHLAYCRCAEVVRRINARPTQAQEWERINADIREIRELSPNNWYGEYLRNLVSERSTGGRVRPSQSQRIVRGSAPDEPPAAAERSAPPRRVDANSPAAPGALAGGAAGAAAKAARTPKTSGSWQVHETANFRIMHADNALAERIARVAEEAREIQIKRWAGAAPRGAWSPKCDIYVYPDSKIFHQMTNQPEDSPGFSTMGLNAGRIIARRVNVRADHPNLLPAILPHEITHVVLADLFPNQQIPRWADEGMAVLSEPPSEQRLRAADLEKPLASGRLFKLNDLMVMDYPDGQFWGLYYAQSVSLTRFLVEQGTPAQFVKFVQGAQQNGLEPELKRVYQIQDLNDLQQRWLTYARTHTAEATAAANPKPGAATNRE